MKDKNSIDVSDMTRKIQDSLSKVSAYTKQQSKMNSTLTLVTTIGSAVTRLYVISHKSLLFTFFYYN